MHVACLFRADVVSTCSCCQSLQYAHAVMGARFMIITIVVAIFCTVELINYVVGVIITIAMLIVYLLVAAECIISRTFGLYAC
jgi:hypothetical protein